MSTAHQRADHRRATLAPDVEESRDQHGERMAHDRRTAARAVGVLLLAVFLLYGIGSSVATSAVTGAALVTGTAMMLANSLAVVAIGVLMLPLLRPHAPVVAAGYLATRILEGTVLAAGSGALLAGDEGVNDIAYTIAIAALGVGSLFLCAALHHHHLVPRALAVWGFLGYAVLATGCVLELTALPRLGLVLTIPGGLFEVALAIWLITRGLRPPVPAPTAGATTSER